VIAMVISLSQRSLTLRVGVSGRLKIILI